MELTVYYDLEKDVVVAEATGPVTTENLKATTQKALEVSEKHHCNYIFFDLTKCSVEADRSIFQGFHDMKDMRQTTGLTYKHKCAVVYDPALFPAERAAFIEDVVANRPNPSFKMFTKQQNALAWLKKRSGN